MIENELGCYEFNPTEEFPQESYPRHLFEKDGYYGDACVRCGYEPEQCSQGYWYESLDFIGKEWEPCGEDVAWRAIRDCGFPMPLCEDHKQEAERSPSMVVDEGDRLLRFAPYDPATNNDWYTDAYYHHGYKDDGTWNREADECHCDTPKEPKEKDDPFLSGFLTP
jgi:hypothetical protein